MRKFLNKYWPTVFGVVLLVLVVGIANCVKAAEVPPVARVTDLAGKLAKPERAKLEARILQIEKLPGSPQVAILIQNVGDTPIADHAQSVFTTWKLGQKDADNGVLILVAPAQRQIRIHTGYGVEPILPDVKTAYITSTVFIPRLMATSSYYRALDDTLTAVQASFVAETAQPVRADFGAVLLIMVGLGAFGYIFWRMFRPKPAPKPYNPLHDNARSYATTAAGGAMGAVASARSRRYASSAPRSEPARKSDSGSDFVTGAIVGAALGSAFGGSSRSDDSPSYTPSYSGGGGDTGGGGSTSSWSDSSSSSSSYDSGSSSSGGDSGGGGGGGGE